MTSAKDIKMSVISFKNGLNKRAQCGCILTKVKTMGDEEWIQDHDLRCVRHRLEIVAEQHKQEMKRLLLNQQNDKSKKRKRKGKN